MLTARRHHRRQRANDKEHRDENPFSFQRLVVDGIVSAHPSKRNDFASRQRQAIRIPALAG